uniref:Uncharacterized protein n=1 Tax=Meloidogyne enterolobii TaxID=390850 RepID=A0A6V7VRU4_MELEN|nr:unnamed protein product [Meloidogyne enterolobii]
MIEVIEKNFKKISFKKRQKYVIAFIFLDIQGDIKVTVHTVFEINLFKLKIIRSNKA